MPPKNSKMPWVHSGYFRHTLWKGSDRLGMYIFLKFFAFRKYQLISYTCIQSLVEIVFKFQIMQSWEERMDFHFGRKNINGGGTAVMYVFTRFVPKLSLLSLDGIVTPSIGIPTKCVYCVIHYLSNKHLQMSVCQIDLELQLFCENSYTFPSRKWEVQEEVDKKMKGVFRVWKHGSVRGKVSASFVIKENTRLMSIHMEMIYISDNVSPHKHENGYFDWTMLTWKILLEIKKIRNGNDCSVERDFPKWCLLFPSLKCKLRGPNFKTEHFSTNFPDLTHFSSDFPFLTCFSWNFPILTWFF